MDGFAYYLVLKRHSTRLFLIIHFFSIKIENTSATVQVNKELQKHSEKKLFSEGGESSKFVS